MALLTSWKCEGEVHLVIGTSSAAVSRIEGCLSVGAFVKVVGGKKGLEIQSQSWGDRVEFVGENFEDRHLTQLGRQDVNNVVDKVFVALVGLYPTKEHIFHACQRLRIPVNTSDSPEFSSFTLLSTHTDGDLQIGVTTNGKGCRLASRIRREIVASLPRNIGAGCARIGELRATLQKEDADLNIGANHVGENDEDAVTTSKINSLVEEFNMSTEQKKQQRTRWLLQIVEYYPLNKLANVAVEDLTIAYKQSQKEEEIKQVNDGSNDNNANNTGDSPIEEESGSIGKNGSDSKSNLARISLVGAGPGSISLLTLGALREIYSADLVLADKLVPQQVIDLIPQKHTKLFIARKFPGNAERAQQELLELGLAALQRGEVVVRLKQGDPYIFGRGGEEYNFFASHGYIPQVLPGITLALAAPVLSNIPATHREVADQVLICTGTGRRGAVPDLPKYKPNRTTVFLMALHRIVELVPLLIENGWEPNLSVAIVERASCPDQRVIRTRLKDLAAAVEANGSRPPGLLVTGHACEVIEPAIKDHDKWIVEEGYEASSVLGIVNVIKLLLLVLQNA